MILQNLPMKCEPMFDLHPQLAADTVLIKKLDICQVLMSRDSRYPWLILVPEIEGAVELHLLDDDSYKTVCEEIRLVADRLYQHFNPQKINIGALGNMVPQLHIHIIARWTSDAAWPGPIWGVGDAVPFTAEQLSERIAEIQNILN